jgi:hypothetical protein
MARLELILVIVFLAFTIFAFIDCIMTSETRVRALPKFLWAIIIVLVTPFGGILWFALGKGRSSTRPAQRQARGPVAPDDDPAFLRRLGEEKEREERIRQLEARLAELDDDQNNPTDT